jgi:hypothetical protein
MKKAFVLMFLCVTGLILTDLRAQPAGSSPRGAPMPTTQQLQQMIDSKQYPDVLKESQRMLQLKGAAAKDVDRYDVLMLRAEAQLQLKQQGPAAESYTKAAKETSDPTKAGLPKAMVTLLQKSRAFMYTPKPSSDPTHPGAPLNILEATDRKQALKALFDDEWKPTQQKIDALKKKGNTSLTPIIEASGLAGEMRGLEIAATGSDAQTSTALSDLTDNASRLMNDYLDRSSKRVEDIERLANLPQSNTINDTTRTGLTGTQMNDLKDIAATCDKLTLAAQQVAASAGAKGADFQTIAGKSTDLGKHANEVLNGDYSSMINNNGGDNRIQRGGQTPMPVMPPRTGYNNPR